MRPGGRWYYPAPDPTTRRLRDLAGNEVRSTRVVTLVNLTALPSVAHATVSGDRLTLTFDDPMDEGSVPAGSAFTVKVGGSEVSLASVKPVAVAGATVVLTLASAVAAGATVTVSYTKPSRHTAPERGRPDRGPAAGSRKPWRASPRSR